MSNKSLQRVGVVYKALQGQQLEMEMAVVWRQDNSSQVLQEFLKVVREIAQPVG
jgi:hypothetical protein